MNYTHEEVAGALRNQGLCVDVIGPGADATFIVPAVEHRSWRVTVYSSEEALDLFLARFDAHPPNMTRRRNVLVTPSSTSASVPASVLAALESLDHGAAYAEGVDV